jgi:hypothetical protein
MANWGGGGGLEVILTCYGRISGVLDFSQQDLRGFRLLAARSEGRKLCRR